jgi:hypothetical protein
MSDPTPLPPRPGIKKPRQPELILPAGVQRIEPQNNQMTPHDGEHWKSALDCLKELVIDIETGRIPPPSMVYVALRTHHPEDPNLVGYPSYCWSGGATGGVAYLGLLAKHSYKINSQ